MQLITGIWCFWFDTSSLRSRPMRVFSAVSFGRWRFSVYFFWKSWEALISRQWLEQWKNWTDFGKRWCILHLTLFSTNFSFCCINVLFVVLVVPHQNQDLVDQYLSVILGLEPNQSYAAMLGLVVQFCTAQKETEIIKRHKVNLPYSCWFGFFSTFLLGVG